jgi:hypothetical protein
MREFAALATAVLLGLEGTAVALADECAYGIGEQASSGETRAC